ncbi:MAG: hypothetical protein Q8O67_14680 [Deltaproteobacteria bacterium]|nr:hypothetical protein [Deltaproteobacteria bacterium]
MVGIRKADSSRNVQQTPATEAEKPKELSPSELTQVMTKVFANLQVHGNEVPALADALKRAGPLKPDLLQNIEKRLGDPNLKVTPETLDKLKGLGLDVSKATENLKKNTDLKTTAKLGQTADKQVEAKVEGQAASTNALASHQAVLDSHKGVAHAKNELTPEFKLGKQLIGDYASKIYADKAPPEMKAMVDAVGPTVSSLAQQTAMSVMQDPNAMANIGQLVTKFGSEGFKAALSSSTKDVAGHFLSTAGIQAKNPEAIKAALSGIEAVAPKLGSSLGPKIAATAQKLGPKLLGDTAQVAGKVAVDAGAKVAVNAGAKVAVNAGAKAAVAAGTKGAAITAAKAGGQALPIIGNVISVGSTLIAGANFIGQLFKKPADFEKIMKEGINTATQGVGIALPWVGLGGTLVDAAWSAKTGVSDGKKQAAGIPVTENANFADALPLLTDSAEVLRSALMGAGKGEAADKVGNLIATTKTMHGLDLNKPGDRISLLRKDQQQALIALAHESKTELDKMGATEMGPRKEGLLKLASVFGALADTTLATMRFDKREATPGFDDKSKKELETKRNELTGNLVKQLGDLGLAELIRRSEDKTAAA